jgi:hypothetical protein
VPVATNNLPNTTIGRNHSAPHRTLPQLPLDSSLRTEPTTLCDVAGAYCALCGTETTWQAGPRTRWAACGPRCAAALEAVIILREQESISVQVASRRRAEYEQGVEHPSALSEIMLKRWRAGDWSISPDQVIAQLAARP